MKSRYPPVHYHDYLQLDRLLNCQLPKSSEYQQPAHDELLFIIVHQTYELWFKQCLFELDSVLHILDSNPVKEKDMGTVVSRLNRVVEIVKLMTEQIRVLETMTPLDFLDFRDMLFPASGFQSFQFRIFENKLGLPPEQRLPYNNQPYHASLTPSQAQAAKSASEGLTLFSAVEKWLERTPFLSAAGFDFWQNYRQAVDLMFQRDEEFISKHPELDSVGRERNLQILESTKKSFSALFDEEAYNQLRKAGQWRFSFRAIHAALFIQIYRDQPVLQLPFRLLTGLIDLDELLTNWRYRHALMAKRMLGAKIGTGGSSGFEYLRAVTEKHKVFQDLFQLTTFFIPRSALPPLEADFEAQLGFHYNAKS